MIFSHIWTKDCCKSKISKMNRRWPYFWLFFYQIFGLERREQFSVQFRESLPNKVISSSEVLIGSQVQALSTRIQQSVL